MIATPTHNIHPLIDQLLSKHGFAEVDAASFAAFSGGPGHRLLVFLEDPLRVRETLDLAVIVPELARTFASRFAVGVLLPTAARALYNRFAFRRWPALVLLRDGDYIGTIDGLRNWDEYLSEMNQLLDAPPSRPPTIGIAVSVAGSASAPHTH
jgi:hydrogenase-1 operon protein HyaE